MVYTIGLVLFALGILVSVILHEAGHFFTARAFGMKVTRFFVGFGPTIWSFRRGDTEYGVKGIPAGAFVKIIGMTPQDDDVAPEDEHRAMWRYPVWQRTVVLAAGSVTHFAIGVLILWGMFAFVPLNDAGRLQTEPVRVEKVYECVRTTWSIDPATGQERSCTPGVDPSSAASQLGLQPGDVITAIDGVSTTGWNTLVGRVRAAGGRQIEVTYERAGQAETKQVTLPVAERVKPDVLNDPKKAVSDITQADLELVGTIGFSPVTPKSAAGPIAAIGKAFDQTGSMFQNTFSALLRLPERIPALWASLTGEQRDPETPVSVIGASHLGGVLFDRGELPSFILLLAALNFFIGMFNLLPLLPADGGHIAIAWFERVRSWIYPRLGRPDPGRVDYFKLMPLTYAMILIFGVFTVLTVAADIINPISIPS